MNSFNLIPIYIINTTFFSLIVSLIFPELKICHFQWLSIDYLPSLLPCEFLEQFSLAPFLSLLQLPDQENTQVWTEAKALFDKNYLMASERLSCRYLRQF
ncbi:uncharacterized protein BT62DRAFT_1055716 [Guyanagaster necrorhizus]|uniref:Uncharacterized protein n=1 Tax=Guyanagaster necrorhizus TaxID=856835 RepID=A0A9P8ALA0_9AGAR|nr:uncharacterized protein BT62DRAFT_1055716 [Guyanagaster necrorhizus MCA 3950]KAG7439565.1 hypothetical protein BT62DRAFT_1055716 [Guyanagaster necrorhizus MCA 3950]